MQDVFFLDIRVLTPMVTLMSFLLVFITIPTVLHIAYQKRLFDKPNKRSSHTKIVPRLGGLPISFAFIFTYFFFADWYSYTYIPFLASSFILVFITGVKDDIVSTAPVIKLLSQLLAAVIIVVFGGVYINEIQGILDVPLPDGLGMLVSVFVFAFLLNGFNLIDGIDGLAAITGIVVLTAFSAWFYLNGFFHMPMLAASLIGGLFAFIYYNMYSSRRKIFMGDTGSLLIGFVVSVIVIKFLQHNNEIVNVVEHPHVLKNSPAVAVAILIVPIVDTIRIFFLRILRGKSPFSPDKNHIHHRMLALGMSHHRISFTIGFVNICFVILGFALDGIGTFLLLFLLLVLGFTLAATPSWILYYRNRHLIRRYKAIHR